MKYLLMILTGLSLSSCAIGSGVSAVSGASIYSINSGEARRLSKDAEELLVIRIKEELKKP
jgi:hypothetical protein